MQEQINRKKLWTPENHPTHFIREKDRYLIDGFFDAIPCLPPHEMFRVIQERNEPLVLMRQSELNDLFWLFLHEWRKRQSVFYRLRHGWKLLKANYTK